MHLSNINNNDSPQVQAAFHLTCISKMHPNGSLFMPRPQSVTVFITSPIALLIHSALHDIWRSPICLELRVCHDSGNLNSEFETTCKGVVSSKKRLLEMFTHLLGYLSIYVLGVRASGRRFFGSQIGERRRAYSNLLCIKKIQPTQTYWNHLTGVLLISKELE